MAFCRAASSCRWRVRLLGEAIRRAQSRRFGVLRVAFRVRIVLAPLLPFASVLGALLVGALCAHRIRVARVAAYITNVASVLSSARLARDGLTRPVFVEGQGESCTSRASPLGEATRSGLVQVLRCGSSWPSFLGCLASAILPVSASVAPCVFRRRIRRTVLLFSPAFPQTPL